MSIRQLRPSLFSIQTASSSANQQSKPRLRRSATSSHIRSTSTAESATPRTTPDCAFRSPPKDNCWPVRRPHYVQSTRRLLPAREPLVLLDSHYLTCLSSDLDHFWRDCKPDSKPI